MALITSQQLSHYYEQYLNIDVTFTKQVSKVIGLQSKQTFLRFLGYQLPCIIYSSSMVGAKIIASLKDEMFQKIRKANDLVSLRFCFRQADKQNPLAFFVGARVTGYNPYSKEHPELNFITMNYTQRPSDDLIAILGQLLEANINSKRRREERIDINPESIRKIGLKAKESTLYVEEVPRTCIIRDLSFSGSKVLVTGVAKYIVEKEIKLRIEVEDSKEALLIPGTVVRFDDVQDRKGIGAAAIHFHEDQVPMAYKMRLNEYLVSVRKSSS